MLIKRTNSIGFINLLMKIIFPLTLILLTSQAHTQENVNPFDVQVSVNPVDGRFQIQASYIVPINICSAFAFITDYEGMKSIPGILEVKVISKVGNKVRVQRVIEEQILFFPIEMKSIMEYTEIPNRLLNFEQISGDTKFYKGSWKLTPDKDKTFFKYEALVEPNSLIPSAVIEYFMKNSIRGRFELMARRANQYRVTEILACK
jgi:Polyketide cyclase / dehydrase and lipid transport